MSKRGRRNRNKSKQHNNQSDNNVIPFEKPKKEKKKRYLRVASYTDIALIRDEVFGGKYYTLEVEYEQIDT